MELRRRGSTNRPAGFARLFGRWRQNVNLTVTDDRGVTDQTAQTVSIGANHAPTAVPGTLQGRKNASISFNGSNSTDVDGDAIVGYQWDFGDRQFGRRSPGDAFLRRDRDYTVTLTVTILRDAEYGKYNGDDRRRHDAARKSPF